jgi:hypothetical protein
MRTFAVFLGRLALVCLLAQATVFAARADEAALRQVPAPRARIDTSTADGYARIVFTLPGQANAEAKLAGGALVIAFAAPVKAEITHAARRLTAYVKNASAEPGLVRLTLAPKVRANVIAAGDKLYVDLLPAAWKGAPPPLPAKVFAALQQTARGALAPDREAVGSIGERALKVEIIAANGETKIVFPFSAPTPAALYRRGDTVSVLFETERPLDIRPLAYHKPAGIRGIELTAIPGGQLLRLKLDAFAALAAERERWVLNIGRAAPKSAAAPLERLVAAEGARGVLIPLAAPSRIFRVVDAATEERLYVVTALARTDAAAGAQDYVEFTLLQAGQGLAIAPRADDLSVEIAAQSVIVSRAKGLAVSAARTARD